jgi:hypothetical protein
MQKALVSSPAVLPRNRGARNWLGFRICQRRWGQTGWGERLGFEDGERLTFGHHIIELDEYCLELA